MIRDDDELKDQIMRLVEEAKERGGWFGSDRPLIIPNEMQVLGGLAFRGDLSAEPILVLSLGDRDNPAYVLDMEAVITLITRIVTAMDRTTLAANEHNDEQTRRMN